MRILTPLRHLFILNKRLLKKPSFLALLLLVPLLVASLAITSRSGDSGILTVALAMKDDTDPVANEIVSNLMSENRLVNFIKASSPKEAQKLVEGGKSDAAWIFPDDMETRINSFAQFPTQRNAFVAVIQREDNIFMKLSHEKLNAALYPYLSLELCENYIYSNILTLDELSEAELEQYYNGINADGSDLFELVYLNAENSPADTASANYLLSPMRGLMSVMIVLVGFAVAMFYIQDESNGTFDRLPRNRRFFFSVGYHAVAVIDIALAVLAALFFTGLSVGFWRELTALLLYVIITVGFCIGLRLLLCDIRLLGAIAPALTVAMTVLCPVFFNIRSLPVIQYMLPPYYYLNAIYDTKFIGLMAIYAAVIYGADYLLYRWRTR